MIIKQPILNTFKRVGIIVPDKWDSQVKVTVYNRFGGNSCSVYPFISYLIDWVYSNSNNYEIGIQNVRIDDFDRIRYFILEADNDAYYTCID
jgi:hypothetical protein